MICSYIFGLLLFVRLHILNKTNLCVFMAPCVRNVSGILKRVRKWRLVKKQQGVGKQFFIVSLGPIRCVSLMRRVGQCPDCTSMLTGHVPTCSRDSIVLCSHLDVTPLTHLLLFTLSKSYSYSQWSLSSKLHPIGITVKVYVSCYIDSIHCFKFDGTREKCSQCT